MILTRYTGHALVALCLFSAACNLAQDSDETVASADGAISIDFLSDRANGILSACARGDGAACDRAQRNAEISDDGVFSRINVACGSGRQAYCDLRKGLVDAELRMRGV
ncbi:hypothetical protein [Oceaniglobus roseus]|uniref:hypothetical protein n=1 Tax=Oceaniglobus roseus TaxID=1737570 RepID=UPI000C7F1BB5|nr:hypothetical protein [Kandeliimicrobium roseum]